MPWRAKSRSWWARKGSPATSSRAFGSGSVNGLMRVASPPARTAIGGIPVIVSLDHRFGALEVEAEAHLFEPLLQHGVEEPSLVLRVEHEKAAAAGADQLSAERPVAHGYIVPRVNFGVRNVARALFLVLPMLVHQLSKAWQVALH